MKYLFIDYGATHIKSCIYDKEKDKFSKFQKNKCPENLHKQPRHEISIDTITKITQRIINNASFDAVYICSQMHGFCLLSPEGHLSDYISWKDETGEIFPHPEFKKKTGLTPRKGLPVFNIGTTAKRLGFEGYRVLTLPEAVLYLVGSFYNKTHVTMACGLGVYDINNREIIPEMTNVLHGSPVFNKVVCDIEVAGTISKDKKEKPVYTPVGDMQCALYGVGLGKGQVSVNLGTGSQVSVLSKRVDERVDNRVFFDDCFLNTKTHIPSGRAIECYVKFLESVSPNKKFWEEVRKYTENEILESDLEVGLSVFGSDSGGLISNIRETNFTVDSLQKSLINSYVRQYRKYIDLFSGDEIILSGGVPQNCPVIKRLFEKVYNRKISMFISSVDETILGLKRLTQER